MKTTLIPSLWSRAGVLAVTLFGLGLAASAGPITYTDNFNRTEPTENLGPNWTCPLYQFVIRSDYATTYQPGGNNYMAYYNVAGTGAGAFSVQADVLTAGAEWVGLAFNVQNAANYSFVRWTSTSKDSNNLQAFTVVGGAYATNQLFTHYANSPINTPSTIKVAGTGTGNYTLTIGSDTWSFANATFTGGFGGLYYDDPHGQPSVIYDNFALTVPEPASLGLLALGGLALLRRRR
jgi:hypothetical protein